MHRPRLRVLAAKNAAVGALAARNANNASINSTSSSGAPAALAPTDRTGHAGTFAGYSLFDRTAVALVLAPLLAAAVLLIAKPGGWSNAPMQRPTSAQSQSAARTASSQLQAKQALDAKVAVTSDAPQSMAAVASDPEPLTVIGGRQSIEGVPSEQLSLAEPKAEILLATPPSELIPAITEESEALGGRERRCELAEAPPDDPAALSVVRSVTSDVQFGLALAEAAMEQTRDFVVYTDSYKNLPFPHGDLPAQFGVCTDVIVRAYRALGVDLQALVYRARIGSGDPSIDHRRTEVLRRFFAAKGESLKPSDVPEDYRPGDIVSYHRPQNSGSQSHIAIVSDIIGVSGRPLIVHNRGWGPQIEDALFVDRMTGHYRYTGAQTIPAKQVSDESAHQASSLRSAGLHTKSSRSRTLAASRVIAKRRAGMKSRMSKSSATKVKPGFSAPLASNVSPATDASVRPAN